MANTIEMPKLGFDMAEGKLIRWVKAENDKVEKGEVLAEIETDKATLEVESTFSGMVAKHLVEENAIVPVGTPIAVITEVGEAFNPNDYAEKANKNETGLQTAKSDEPPVPEATSAQESVSGDSGEMLKASPLAKRIAEEEALDLTAIAGTGPGGRIVKRDIEKAQKAGSLITKDKTAQPARSAKISSGKDETIEISRLRAAIGKRMLESHQNIPYFTITRSYEVGDLMELRKEMNADLEDADRISVNDLFIKAAALALKQFPNLNASISGSTLTRHAAINIGVAVAVENGLLTIVVRNADQKSLSQISGEMKEMSSNVRDGKIRTEDIEGSTFTISNLGMFGVEDFTAIINPPEAAILAIGSAAQVPVVADGTLGIGWRAKATLSADHRITDGAEAAQYMQHLAVFLEQPWRLFSVT